MTVRRVLGILMVFSVTAGIALADPEKTEKFRNAASQTGCKVIPYDVEKTDCENKQQEMKEKICTEYGCDRKEAEKALENYKQKKQNLEDAKYRKNEQAIPDLEVAVKLLNEDLTRRKTDAEVRYNKCAACISARTDIQKIFVRVIDKMKSEPEKEIQTYISSLTSHFEQEGKKHNDQIDQVNNARSNCDWVRSMSW